MDNLLLEISNYNSIRKDYFRKGIDSEFIPFYDSFLNARYSKVSRIKKHIIYLLNHKKFCYFLTFTFDDDLLSKCDRTQRDTIKNCLLSFDDSSFYILNVDFGKKNDRKHFHCIYGTDSNCNLEMFLKLTYPSFTYTEKIRLYSNDISKVSKYINKLSNHTNKDSTHNKRVVYNFHAYDRLDPYLSKLCYVFDKERLGL